MADTPKVFVICDQNCKYEGMTKEQILAAIVQAVNEGSIGNIDTGFIQTVKTINGLPLKFFVGTQAEYEALTEEDKQDLFAIITNDTTLTSIQEKLETLLEFKISAENGELHAKTADRATSANEAIKARQDSAGNSIVGTYGKFSGDFSNLTPSGNTFLTSGGTYLFKVRLDRYDGTIEKTTGIFCYEGEEIFIFLGLYFSELTQYAYRLKVAAGGKVTIQQAYLTINSSGANSVKNWSDIDATKAQFAYKKIL